MSSVSFRSLELIDEGETDHKIIALRVTDPDIDDINNMEVRSRSRIALSTIREQEVASVLRFLGVAGMIFALQLLGFI